MVDWCIEHRVQLRAEPDEFRKVLRRGRLLVVAQELQQSLGGQLNTCLSAILHSGKTRPSEAHRLISKTNWIAALSSNYDGLIEGAYALETGGIVPPVFSPDGIGQALDCLRNGRFFVFKVHGDVNLPGSIVLSNRDYARLLYLSPGYRSFLEAVFSSYTVLFVGFGGTDPDLDGIIDRLSTIYERSIGQHFILISEDEFSALERRRLLEDKRLDCITDRRDASHSQVVEFLRALSQRTAPDAEEEVPFVGEQRQPRVFISGSYHQIDLIREVGEVAKHAGFEVWFAESQVSAGDRIVDMIAKAIDEADCLIAVLSDEAAASSWVQFEIGRAFGARKKVLPIRIGQARMPSDLMGLVYLQVSGPALTPEDKARIMGGLRRLLESEKAS
ncbi:MAG: SIR2 family protein [Planctomycetota bacterium]